MNWTNEKPAKPGWYWYRETASKECKIIEVYGPNGGELYYGDHGFRLSLRGQFAGPIPEPTDPAAKSPFNEEQAEAVAAECINLICEKLIFPVLAREAVKEIIKNNAEGLKE